MSVNKIILVGRLGNAPEVKQSNENGKGIVNFTMATSEGWKDKGGNKQERTEWHRIVAFGKLAEIMARYLKKGQQVYLEGRIQTREWEHSDGGKRYTTEIVAKQMQMLGSKGDTPQEEDVPMGSEADDVPF